MIKLGLARERRQDIEADRAHVELIKLAAGSRREERDQLAIGKLDFLTGVEISHATLSNLEVIIFGSLIIFFLIVEPAGLARLWQITKEKLRLWPFPH